MVVSLPLQPSITAPALVGFSGGLDSTVLLHWLASLPEQRRQGLRAIHVHHGLQADADRWADHCRHVCAHLEVPLQVARVQVPPIPDLGLEAAAREARHAAFATALAAGERLASAHHLDDQAETFLLRALRASGPDGLAAMASERPFAGGSLWRPLLQLPRQALLEYAQAHRLSWIEDPSNAQLDYDRNFLRHAVLPVLRERWPHAASALARSAALSGQASALLESADTEGLHSLLDADGAMPLDGLRRHLPARRARLLRLWVQQRGLPPLPARGIQMLEAELAQPQPDRESRFAWQGVEIRRWRQHLYLRQPTLAWPRAWQAEWDGAAALPLPDGGQLWLQAPVPLRFPQPLWARARQGGERLVLPGRLHSHQLKHLLQQAGIPPWRRLCMPLLFDGPQLQAAGDRLLGAWLQAWLQANSARLCWQPADQGI